MPLHHGLLLPEVLITTFLQGLASLGCNKPHSGCGNCSVSAAVQFYLTIRVPCTFSKQDARFFQMYMKVRTQFFPSIWKSANFVLLMMFELTLRNSSNLHGGKQARLCGPTWKWSTAEGSGYTQAAGVTVLDEAKIQVYRISWKLGFFPSMKLQDGYVDVENRQKKQYWFF